MKLFRKGISPLIATVLIIGFTVALAAIIMTWGTTFSKGMQKTTESTTEEQLACAQDVVIDLSSACIEGSNIKLTIKNDGSKDLQRVSVRLYDSASTVGTAKWEDIVEPINPVLTAYGLKTIVLATAAGAGVDAVVSDLTPLTNVRLAEIIPVIKVGEKELTCAATKDYFGDQNYEDVLTACAVAP